MRVRTGAGKTKLLIDLLVRARGTPGLKTELLEYMISIRPSHGWHQITHLMTVLLPAESLSEYNERQQENMRLISKGTIH